MQVDSICFAQSNNQSFGGLKDWKLIKYFHKHTLSASETNDTFQKSNDEKINKYVELIVNEVEDLKKFESNGNLEEANPNITKTLKKTALKVDENRYHRIPEEKRKISNYENVYANYSSFEYFPNGKIKSYEIKGDEQECYGSFYPNGNKEKSLQITILREYNGSRGYYVDYDCEFNEFDKNGNLINNLKTSTNPDYYCPEHLLYKTTGATYFDNKETTPENKFNSTKILNKLLDKENFNKYFPEIQKDKIVTLRRNTWLLPDGSMIHDHNGMYSCITADKSILYDMDLNKVAEFDIINGNRIRK